MTREEAIYYLQSSGFSEEQMDTIEQAFTCEDAISRRAVEKITWEEPSYSDALNVLTEVRDKVRALPPVNPQPKMGHWIRISPAEIYECSECGQNVMTSDICAYRFCHGCGAKMVEPQESEG